MYNGWLFICNSRAEKNHILQEKKLEDLLKIEQGARFEKVLKRLKMSQVALSQLTGLSQPLISQICIGKREITRNTEM